MAHILSNFFTMFISCFTANSIFFQIFERILFIWAIRHPASGYVQGINDLVTPFFVVFICEYIGRRTPQHCAFWMPSVSFSGSALFSA